jgi:hypothetical protein
MMTITVESLDNVMAMSLFDPLFNPLFNPLFTHQIV